VKGIMGRKVGMTQIFNADGLVVPVTVIAIEPNAVVQVKTMESDGYNSIQVGFDTLKEKNVNKPTKGHFEKAGVEPKRKLKEFRVDNPADYTVGQELKADFFQEGEKVDVTGISKGKGFQGSIKRHGQHRGPMSHGSRYHRRSGSMGASAYPARVFKGKKLPGHMGAVQITVQNLEVIKVDVERNALLVKGAVPGPKKGLVIIKQTTKRGK